MSSVSVRLYLKIENESQLEKPVEFTRSHRYYLNGTGIDYDEKRKAFFYRMDLLEDKFPEDLKDFVENVSIRGAIILTNPRRSGKYSYLTAEGFVENLTEKKSTIMVTGTSFNDAKNLYSSILCGKIFPSEDWEGEQISGNSKIKGIAESVTNIFLSAVKTAKEKLSKVRG